MSELNKRYELQIEVLTPLHVGAGAEKDWVQGCDFVLDNNQVKILNLKKVSQHVNISDLTNALLSKNSNELKAKLAKNLDLCVEKTFNGGYSGTNDIKKKKKNGLTNNPIVPGSSLKGAIRSILLQYLMTDIEKLDAFKTKRLDEKVIFGKANIGDEFLRFIKVSDAEFATSDLVNTKIFNLISPNEGGWKHGGNNTNNQFKPDGFNTYYEVVNPKQKSVLSISIADKAFNNFAEKIASFSPKKTKLINEDLSLLFELINKHTKEYLEKEKAFFEKYATDKTDLIIQSIKSLIDQIPVNGEYCILKMGTGSGFHSITGDWQFDDYSIDRVYSEYTDRRTGQLKQKSRGNEKVNGKFEESAKSRKIAISGNNDFSLMGFVKLTVMDEKMLKAIEQERLEEERLVIEAREKAEKEKAEKTQLEMEAMRKIELYNSLILEANQLFEINEYQKALAKIEEAEKELPENHSHRDLKKSVIDALEFQKTLASIQDAKRLEEEQRVQKILAMQQGGLGAYLEEKNLNDEYKVKDFKMLKVKVEKYLKDSGNADLPKDQYEVLGQNIQRIYNGLKPNDKKEWQGFENSKLWKVIVLFASEESARLWYSNIVG